MATAIEDSVYSELAGEGAVYAELVLDPDDLREAQETGRVRVRFDPDRAIRLGDKMTRHGYRSLRWAEANEDRYVTVGVAGCEPPVGPDGAVLTDDDGCAD